MIEIRIEGKKMRKRLIAALLIMLLCMGMSMTAYAVPQITPEEQPPAEATEEEAQAFKAAQLKKYYDMPVATNEIKGWPQGPGTYGEAAIIMEAGTGAILYGKILMISIIRQASRKC